MSAIVGKIKLEVSDKHIADFMPLNHVYCTKTQPKTQAAELDTFKVKCQFDFADYCRYCRFIYAPPFILPQVPEQEVSYSSIFNSAFEKEVT